MDNENHYRYLSVKKKTAVDNQLLREIEIHICDFILLHIPSVYHMCSLSQIIIHRV